MESDLAARAARLAVDARGAEVRAALEAVAIPCLLLKGRAFANLLYDADELRVYGDCDLLVPESDRTRAEAVLTRLGFHNTSQRGGHLAPEPLHAEHWHRSRDSAAIDLHTRLRGSHAPAGDVFSALWEHKVTAEIGGRETWVLDPVGSAVMCALHKFHPLARRGRWGLALAYALRPLQVARRAPAALAHWRATRSGPDAGAHDSSDFPS
jgi:Uncharacterised nucleotidyltransferase